MKPLLGKLVENLLCLAVLAVIAAVAQYPIWLDDAVPADVQALFAMQPWEDAGPATLSAGATPDALKYFAWYAFLHDSVNRGGSLLWNPRELCGVPFMALWSTRVFSPFSLPFYFFPVPDALQISVFFKLIVAGWCAFYMARRLGFLPAPAFLVGAAFELSGIFLLWQSYPLSDTLPWLPLWLIFLNRLAVGQYRYWPFGGMVLALMLAGGDPRAAGILVLFAFVFLTLQHARPHTLKRFAAAIFSLLLGTTLGVLLLGVQIVPYAEWLYHAVPLERAEATFPQFSDIIVLFLPNFFGTTHDAITTSSYGWNPQTAGVVYAGISSLLLVVLWIALRFSAPESLRKRVEGLLMTAILFSTAGFLVGGLLEPNLFPRYFFLANDLVFGLVGAAAVEEWVDLNAEECKRTLKRFFSALAVGTLLLAILVAVRYHDHRPHAPALWLQLAWLFGIAGAFVLLLGITALKPSRRLTAYGVSVLVTTELLWTYMPRMAHADTAQFFPRTEFIHALQESGGRVGGGPILGQWPLGVHGIPQVYGPAEAVSQRFHGFAERLHQDPLLVRRTASETLLLTKDDIQGPFAVARSALRIQHVLPAGAVLFEDLDVKPRVWLAYDWISEPEGALDKIASASPPVVETTIAAPDPGDGPAPRAQLSVQSGNDHVVIQADLERPGLLVLADAFYPGWNATIDGDPTPILAVDSMFRGIEVGKGRHQIEFIYEPESVRLGLIVSLIGIAVFAAGMLFTGAQTAWQRSRSPARPQRLV